MVRCRLAQAIATLQRAVSFLRRPFSPDNGALSTCAARCRPAQAVAALQRAVFLLRRPFSSDDDRRPRTRRRRPTRQAAGLAGATGRAATAAGPMRADNTRASEGTCIALEGVAAEALGQGSTRRHRLRTTGGDSARRPLETAGQRPDGFTVQSKLTVRLAHVSILSWSWPFRPVGPWWTSGHVLPMGPDLGGARLLPPAQCEIQLRKPSSQALDEVRIGLGSRRFAGSAT